MLSIFRFLQAWSQTMVSCLRMLVWTNPAYTFQKKTASGDSTLYILANGPSLNDTLQDPNIHLQNKEIMCLNNFSSSDYFATLKPHYYMLQAPEFFEDKVGDYYRGYRNKILQTIADKTHWPMILLLPSRARKFNEWKSIIKTNTNVQVVYFNQTPLEGFDWFLNLSFKNGLGTPRIHNTLVACIYYGLMTGYKKLIFFGADHSWHEDIEVNEKNELIGKHNHFYSDKKIETKVYKLDGQSYKIHELFRKIYLTFRGYIILKSFATYMKAEVLNGSSKSYIDAFDRVKL